MTTVHVNVYTDEQLDNILTRVAIKAVEQYIAKQSEPKEDPEEWISYEQVAKEIGYCVKRVGYYVTKKGIQHENYPGNGRMQAIQRKHLSKLPRKAKH